MFQPAGVKTQRKFTFFFNTSAEIGRPCAGSGLSFEACHPARASFLSPWPVSPVTQSLGRRLQTRMLGP